MGFHFAGASSRAPQARPSVHSARRAADAAEDARSLVHGRRLFGLATAATALYMLRVFYRRLSTKHAAIRRDLAAAHLLSSHHKYDELVWNHISCRLPDEPSAFLITPARSCSTR